MKKKYTFSALGLILIGLATTACSNSSSKTNEYSSNSEKTENAVNNSTSKTQKGFDGNTYTTKNGSITFDKVTNVKVSDQYRNPDNFTMVIVEGIFTNKSNKSVSPEDWVRANFEFNQVLPSSEREIAIGSNEHDNGTKWDDLFRNSESKVLPGKTIKFAIEYDLDSKTDKVSETYHIQAKNDYDNQPIGKPYEVKAGTDTFTYSDSDNDSSTNVDTNN